jgi:catechol 2,3-dioxygenase-like lactoylglutathione lyase family enzyme
MMSELFGPVGQLGIVVRDLDAALHYWTEKMRVGPFFVFNQLDVLEFNYLGEPIDKAIPFDTRVALANNGPLQIELIHQRSSVRTSYTDFLDAGYEGLHHLGYFTEDYDELLRRGLDAGLVVEQNGVLFSPQGKFAYFATSGHPGTIQELIAVHDGNRELFEMVASSAVNWDGQDPIRNMN